ncbi:MAG: hypothetical protein Q8L34_01005, partial [Candidatus Woesearchaeota archaeon]|nr:hypothetical protein [Candidatus Woesearchaeota archaeon]
MSVGRDLDKKVIARIREKLIALVNKTLKDKEVGSKIIRMLNSYKLSVEDLKREVLSYTIDKAESGYDNKRYQKVIARQALFFHNLVSGTYHRKRHDLTLQFLKYIKAETLIDIGYGVPGPYLIS